VSPSYSGYTGGNKDSHMPGIAPRSLCHAARGLITKHGEQSRLQTESGK